MARNGGSRAARRGWVFYLKGENEMNKTFWKVFGIAAVAVVVVKVFGPKLAPWVAKIPVVGPSLAAALA